MYSERPAGRPGAVLWSSTGPAPALVLPDGCMDLLWDGSSLRVAGPDTTAFVPPADRAPVHTGLRLPPGAAPALLGVPAHALRDQHVELSDLWGEAAVAPWVERLAASDRPGEVLDALAGDRARDAADPDPSVAAIVARMEAAEPVRVTAAALGFSERQLHRRSLEAFGYGPKLLARILRMQRALALARRGEPFAQVAATAGYFDQPHLARDVRELAGVPLGQLVG